MNIRPMTPEDLKLLMRTIETMSILPEWTRNPDGSLSLTERGLSEWRKR